MDQQSYSAGLNIGQQLVGMGIADLPSLDDFLKGIKDAVEGAAEKAKKAEAEGKAFLEANAKKEGVIVLPSGLQYMVLKEGTGKNPGATSQVKC
ncbi:MAG: FKBP-type peptidyl-prolyl cis-trans isomerase N-terminal domain-containing protein, partial [Bacteroidaceae bacterium]|nr:FKBP-type peptidyl-prolyl cis-trans isomerase N-terminal domain-containing protein [Bacteroidaceae bacterium]